MLRIVQFLSLMLFICTLAIAQNKITISGVVKSTQSGETLPSVFVKCLEQEKQVLSNYDGYYSIDLTTSSDSVTLVFAIMGFDRTTLRILPTSNQRIDVMLNESAVELEEAVIEVNREYKQESKEVQMSKNSISTEQVKETPALFGEKDVIKTLQLLPGVQSGTEGSSGIFVRGGTADQNLILLDGAPVYNPLHLMGIFSTFNGDAIKSIDLIKGGFPAQYGGRLSSVIDLQMKEGNAKQIHGEAGIGLISSRLLLEGPLVKDKLTFMFSARRTYLDVLAYPIILVASRGDFVGGYSFHDLNGKLVYRINPNMKLSYSAYNGRDKGYGKTLEQGYNSEAGLKWGNNIQNLSLSTVLSPKWYNKTSLIYSGYKFSIYADEQNPGYEDFSFEYRSVINDLIARTDFDYNLNNKQTFKMGVQITHHTFTPGAFQSSDEFAINTNIKEKALESSIYLGDQIKLKDNRLTLNPGVRFTSYVAGEANYYNAEPRFAAAYQLKNNQAIKGAYSLMNQYIHLMANNSVGLPTDIWLPSTDKLPPQQSQQVALGYVRDFDKIKSNLTIEGYYKWSKNVKMYKEGSSLFLIEDPDLGYESSWEESLTNGDGLAYGFEVLFHKKEGRFNGWLGYTLSWTKVQFDDLNNGKSFYPRQDRRHDLSTLATYKISDKIRLSASWVFGTGSPISLSTEEYPIIYPENSSPEYYNGYVQHYDEKNNFRMANYHHLDLGIRFYKKLEKINAERNWDITFYNVYARRNPFFYSIEEDYNSGIVELVKYSLFTFVPSFSYNLTF